MNDTDSIISWLQSLPEYPDCSPKPSRKRKLPDQQQLTSPPASNEEGDNDKMASTPKKRRLMTSDNAGPLLDTDTTPRPGARAVGSASVSQSEPSSMSGTSSPKKQMMNLRLSESGVEFKALDVDADTLPDAARQLVNTMKDVGRALDILPHAMESIIMERVKVRSMEPRDWRYSFRPTGEMDNLPGRIPTFEEVEKIHRKASECQEFNHEEASWNSQVHLHLLESIFEELLGRQCDQFNAMSCTTARPHRAFKPFSSPIKMIDICIYASFDEMTDISASILKFSRMSPTQTVNHTDFEPISTRPLMLSIETKKPVVHWDTAQLQIGIWHSAQWSFLRWAVGQKLLRQRAERGENFEDEKDEAEFETKKLSILSNLGFIPGVIVQGHRWHLVLSTYEDGKTKLWTDRQFGTTQSCLEIYATIAGMRQLTAWAKDVYLPWFKENVLD